MGPRAKARKPPERRKPIYLAIQQALQEMIGVDFAPGDRVPSERALAERFKANRMTVRKAIERLVAMGLLERNGTSGTRVARPRVARPVDTRAHLGIARIIRSSGGTPGNKLLSFTHAPASAKVAQRLGVPEGTELVVFRRLWTVDEMPFCIETSHIAADRVPGLAAEDLTAGQSLYALLRERYGVEATTDERLIGIASLTETEARLLHLEPGAAALLLRLVAFDAKGRPIEYMASVNHPQLVVFQTPKAEMSW
jgi:GntR family transcriptional regulator